MTGGQSDPKFFAPQNGDVIRSFLTQKHYSLGKELGAGNFGTVYECTDDWDNELVAKVLKPKGTYDEVKERWLDEARKLTRLRHPNITYIYDLFEYQTTFYIVMERASFPVEALLADPSTHGNGEAWILPIAQSVLQAVHFLHHEGFAHKDLHPGNIFAFKHKDLVGAGSAWTFKVGDLGITRLASDIDPLNTVLAQWMLPPEAIDPQAFGRVGPQTDIYHLGLLFLRLLRGKDRQFSRKEILSAAPRLEAESINSRFSPAIAKALRRTVEHRTQTALELWNDIRAASDVRDR